MSLPSNFLSFSCSAKLELCFDHCVLMLHLFATTTTVAAALSCSFLVSVRRQGELMLYSIVATEPLEVAGCWWAAGPNKACKPGIVELLRGNLNALCSFKKYWWQYCACKEQTESNSKRDKFLSWVLFLLLLIHVWIRYLTGAQIKAKSSDCKDMGGDWLK